ATAQLPTGALYDFTFTNGSLVNQASPGTADLTDNNQSAQLVADRTGSSNDAYRMNTDNFINTRQGNTADQKEVSISFWMRANDADITAAITQLLLIDSPNGYFNIRIDNSVPADGKKLSFYSRGSTASGDRFASGRKSIPTLLDGQWHHVGITTAVTGSTINFTTYVDGVEETNFQQFGLSNPNSGGAPLFLSDPRMIVAPQGGFAGILDDIKYYERTLTPTEITALANDNAPATIGTEVYVNASATGTGTGADWTNAYTNLRLALDNHPGKDFWVAAGTYTIADGTIAGKSSSFIITDNTNVYGGFNGTESLLADRDPVANETIITGDQSNDDVATGLSESSTDRSDNIYTVIKVAGDNITIDGLTITGGHANGTTGETKSGSAIKVTPGNGNGLIVTNCTLKSNFTSTAGAFHVPLTGNSATILLDRCIFTENVGQLAPVVYGSIQTSGITLDLTISNSLIYANRTVDTSSGSQTGNMIWYRSDIGQGQFEGSIINNTITENSTNQSSSSNRGVLWLTRIGGFSNVDIANNIIVNNTNGNSNLQEIAVPAGNFNYPNNTRVINNLVSTNIQSGSGIFSLGNLTGVAMFTDAANNDFTLAASSQAINAGDNNEVPATSLYDLLGNDRIANTTVDMGAYEFGSTAGIEEVTRLDF
ncbi:MAG: LamG domain-containing protein, partial [Nonlabens sp.]|nr:LamG domain-containing protein [Nonlabens sp.]